jgi:hypothetical protein
MTSVANVVMNRVAKNNSSPYVECVKPLQFSSITAKGDPELALWPTATDPQWALALAIAEEAAVGKLVDITGGAVLYYDPLGITSKVTYTLPGGQVVPFPEGWNPAAVSFTVEISKQLFFQEV